MFCIVCRPICKYIIIYVSFKLLIYYMPVEITHCLRDNDGGYTTWLLRVTRFGRRNTCFELCILQQLPTSLVFKLVKVYICVNISLNFCFSEISPRLVHL